MLFTYYLDMGETFDAEHHPALQKDDSGLLSDIQAILAVRAVGDPYSEDGSFAAVSGIQVSEMMDVCHFPFLSEQERIVLLRHEAQNVDSAWI